MLIRLSLAALVSSLAWAQTGAPSFEKGAYIVLEKAGCPACHNADGVAAGTRLLFPEGNVSPARVEAYVAFAQLQEHVYGDAQAATTRTHI